MPVKTHGLSGHPLYKVWDNMKRRCLDPKNKKYKYYGARGISICERWLTFENFYADMLPAYKPGLTIDRIDNDGNYTPENCRWATWHQQNHNTRQSILFKKEKARKIQEAKELVASMPCFPGFLWGGRKIAAR